MNCDPELCKEWLSVSTQSLKYWNYPTQFYFFYTFLSLPLLKFPIFFISSNSSFLNYYNKKNFFLLFVRNDSAIIIILGIQRLK